MKRAALWLIRFYQRFLSGLKPPCCRFYPTCSQYALEAVGRFGFFRGGYLALKRILRCNPLFKGGIDPVPERFSFFRKREG
ncbi:MAG: membrane protein insertion efficiency factor YidD [Oscillospiraceae bacterium]|nr:membrane protein insertion efficiency factor YidD [Oscillospiraceae bacterium]